MTRRMRTLRLIATLVVLVGTLMSLVGRAIPVQAQDEGTPAANPPEFPIEIVFKHRYFLFDQMIPSAPDGVDKVGRENDLTLYTKKEKGPDDRLFVSSSPDRKPVARYLPEIPVGADGNPKANACPAQPQDFGDLQSGDDVYAYAGSEPDVPLESLASIASTAEGFTVYADAAQQPPLDLLMDTGSDVVRFILLDDEGRPPVLGETLQFQGVSVAFEADAAGSVETATLAPAGCAGPFQLSAPVDQVEAGAVDQLYATVGTRLLSYRAADAAQIAAPKATTAPIQEETDQSTEVAAETGAPAPNAGVEAEATPPDGATDEVGVVETEPAATEPAATASTDVTQSDETATAAEAGTLPR